MTDYFELVVSPHFRPDGTKHPNTFDARLAGSDTVLCVSETPLFDAARALLAQGKVNPDDTLVMRHAGSDHYAFRGRVGVAAGLRVAEDASGVRLRKYQPYRQVPPCIEQTPSLAPYPPPAAETYARA